MPEIQSKEMQTKLKPGRPRIEIDLQRVEELAALGLTQARIAEGLGVSGQLLSNRKHGRNGNGEGILIGFAEAIKRGHFKWSESLARKVETRLTAGGPTADNMLMFSTKQYHGLGWMDERSVRHSGTIEHVVRAVDVAWDRRKEMIEQGKAGSQPVIEAEFTEVEDK